MFILKQSGASHPTIHTHNQRPSRYEQQTIVSLYQATLLQTKDAVIEDTSGTRSVEPCAKGCKVKRRTS